MKYIKLYENFSDTNLIICDVQKSFKKWFTDKYLSELNKYCLEFSNVYQIFDNHPNGKNPDNDFLYDDDHDIDNKKDLYRFNNQKDLIEKRYLYDVDVEYFKKILSKETYNDIKSKKLKRGDIFITTEDTYIVYIANNHRWFHCPKSLSDLLNKLKGKEVVMVGGAEHECWLDVETVATSLGVIIKPNSKYIYSSTNCPI